MHVVVQKVKNSGNMRNSEIPNPMLLAKNKKIITNVFEKFLGNFYVTLDFQAASRQSGMKFLDPKPLQIAS